MNPDVKVEEEIYHFANTVFDYSTNEIRTGNSKTLVTSRQAEILRILARNPNVAIDREIFLSAVWGNVSYANSLALNVQVTYQMCIRDRKEGWERNDGIEGPILLLAPVCVSTFCSSVTLFPRLFPL